MKNPIKRTTQLIVAIGSLLAIIVIGIPWVDEYVELRQNASDFGDLQRDFSQARIQRSQLDRIEVKLGSELARMKARSIPPDSKSLVRERLVEIVRRSGARIRRLELTGDDQRPWAMKDDDPRRDQIPIYGEESEYVLHKHVLELQIDGSLESIQRSLADIIGQGWLMTTRSLILASGNDNDFPLRLELRLVTYGLEKMPAEMQDGIAVNDATSQQTLPTVDHVAIK